MKDYPVWEKRDVIERLPVACPAGGSPETGNGGPFHGFAPGNAVPESWSGGNASWYVSYADRLANRM